MMRQIIKIDREKCDGCGLCVDACHEGAIALIKGKAKLIREDHCDGLGDCLPVCPAGAITIITKDVLPFSVTANDIPLMRPVTTVKCDCTDVVRNKPGSKGEMERWPIQLKLVNLKSAFFNGADLLVAADCTAFVAKDFHEKFVKDRVILVGCPKLDREEYGQRLAQIMDGNDVRSITLLRMDIPCCSAMSRMVKEGMSTSIKNLPLETIILSTDGKVVG
ncbi:MAG: 4Fe-4S binding protein [Methanomassiliicoccaceae archaeon]|jgi:ferredoxin|nr:4Fe-4S binding protein [Methanomassiliicoccaceae archaeon]